MQWAQATWIVGQKDGTAFVCPMPDPSAVVGLEHATLAVRTLAKVPNQEKLIRGKCFPEVQTIRTTYRTQLLSSTYHSM